MKVNLGSGSKLKEGFLNIDILNISAPNYVRWDLTEGLPPQAIGIDFVYSEHFLEHLTLDEGKKLLKDCYDRMLFGAKIRICVPSFFKLAKAYMEKDYEHFSPLGYAAPNSQLMEWVNYSIYGEGHKTMYDTDYLCLILEEIGFKNVTVDFFDPETDSPERKQFSCYVVAEKVEEVL